MAKKKGGHRAKDQAKAARVGAALKAVRASTEHTQASLAEAAGVHQMVVSKYEQGRRVPSVLAAMELLGAMGKTLADFQAAYDRLGEPPAADAGTGRGPK